MWQELFDSLEKVVAAGYDSLPKPRPEDLDKYEAQKGFRLPASYRQFCLVFGPGSFDGAIGIRMAGYRNDDRADICTINNKGSMTFERLSKRHSDPVRVQRLIYFADTIGGHEFGWDPVEVTDSENHEYSIYAVLHDDPSVSKVASTFCKFIEDCCLTTEDGTRRETYELVPQL